jgi:hypothetical protein
MKYPSWAKASLSLTALLFSYPAYSWNVHEHLMPFILDTSSPELEKFLHQKATAPCEPEDQSMFLTLANQLLLNPKGKVPATTRGKCGTGVQLSAYEVLAGSSVDDPDQGFDKDLPTEPGNHYDPQGDRIWMGGETGPSSQGFRHMFFGGWQPSRPLATFQLPFHAIGQAPQRFELMARKAKELIRSGHVAWGSRVMTWSMHYIQDLSQPFHSAQLINLNMVPWYSMWTWPPTEAFDTLRKQTTRVITNYHWAYEGYTQYQVEKRVNSPFVDCLAHPEKYSKLQFDPKTQPLSKLVEQVTEASIRLAPILGSSELEFFGTHMRDPGVDFTKNTHMIDFAEIGTRPDLEEARKNLHRVTCEALANSSLASRWLIEWVQL